MPTLIAEPLSRCAAPERVRWLWEPYLPRGRLALLDGHPGVGKSLLTLDLIARLSRGGSLPTGGGLAQPGVSLVLSAEDGTDTIRARSEAAGADLDRIISISSGGAPLLLPAQLPDLEEIIWAHHADLVVIDPLLAFLPPEVATNLEQCVRGVLTPLSALAERTDCAILLVRHLRKAGATRAVLRGQGSIGIVAAARTAWLAEQHPTDPTLCVLAVMKSNVSGSARSLGYRVKSDAVGRAVIEWTGVVNLSADEVGVSAEPLRMRDQVSRWLAAELANGPRRVLELLSAAAEAGIPEITLRRAKEELEVRSHRVTLKDRREWFWYDPALPWPADASFRKPFELPPLDDL